MSIVNEELGEDFAVDVNIALEPVFDRYIGWMCSRATKESLLDAAASAVQDLILAAEGRE